MKTTTKDYRQKARHFFSSSLLLAVLVNFSTSCQSIASDPQKVEVGQKAPEFSAYNQDQKLIRLNELKGKYVLLFFYPADETPGCTKEVCTLRDEFTRIQSLNTVIYGASRQDAKSHKEFIKKHNLPFDLLVDTDAELAKKFGVGTMPVVGYIKRQSVLIGPDQKIVKIYRDVDPEGHSREVYQDILNDRKMKQNPTSY